jgi:hypothetical protein
MIKLKKLLKESIWGKRNFGEPLPTMADYKKAHNEEKLTEKTYRSEDEMGGAMRVVIEDLKKALKKADRGRLGPEGWAEKYHKSASNVIDQIIHLTKILGKM